MFLRLFRRLQGGGEGDRKGQYRLNKVMAWFPGAAQGPRPLRDPICSRSLVTFTREGGGPIRRDRGRGERRGGLAPIQVGGYFRYSCGIDRKGRNGARPLSTPLYIHRRDSALRLSAPSIPLQRFAIAMR